MAILAECPFCHKKQSAKNKKCWNEKTKNDNFIYNGNLDAKITHKKKREGD